MTVNFAIGVNLIVATWRPVYVQETTSSSVVSLLVLTSTILTMTSLSPAWIEILIRVRRGRTLPLSMFHIRFRLHCTIVQCLVLNLLNENVCMRRLPLQATVTAARKLRQRFRLVSPEPQMILSWGKRSTKSGSLVIITCFSTLYSVHLFMGVNCTVHHVFSFYGS